MIVVPGVALLDPIPEKNQWHILATVAATQAKDSAGNYCYELWVWHFNCYMDVSAVRHEALTFSGFIQKIATIFQGLFKDFSRTTLDFQGQPTRNIISQIVQKCIFPVYSNKTLRL